MARALAPLQPVIFRAIPPRIDITVYELTSRISFDPIPVGRRAMVDFPADKVAYRFYQLRNQKSNGQSVRNDWPSQLIKANWGLEAPCDPPPEAPLNPNFNYSTSSSIRCTHCHAGSRARSCVWSNIFMRERTRLALIMKYKIDDETFNKLEGEWLRRGWSPPLTLAFQSGQAKRQIIRHLTPISIAGTDEGLFHSSTLSPPPAVVHRQQAPRRHGRPRKRSPLETLTPAEPTHPDPAEPGPARCTVLDFLCSGLPNLSSHAEPLAREGLGTWDELMPFATEFSNEEQLTFLSRNVPEIPSAHAMFLVRRLHDLVDTKRCTS